MSINTWTKRGNGICVTILYCSEDQRRSVASLLHSLKLGKMQALEKRKEDTLKVFAFTLFQKFLWSDGDESPRAGESSVLWSGRVIGRPSPPFLPLTLELPRKAAWQSELIVTHSGRSSLALPHMVTRCAERRGQAGEASSEGRETSSFISNLVICLLCLSVLC